MKPAIILTFFLNLLLTVSSLYAQDLECTFYQENTLNYKDYKVMKSKYLGSKEWFAIIKKEDKTLSTFSWGDGTGVPEPEWITFGLCPFLGGKEPQLIIEQVAMCAHCGPMHWITNLSPDFEVIYQSKDYQVVGGLDPLDLDKDGVFEFTEYLETFAYFNHLSYANSPFPIIIFQYDKKAKKYLPANHKFSNYTLKEIRKKIEAVKQLNAVTDFKNYEDGIGDYLTAVLKVVLEYIYSGKEQEAWEFYDKEYRLKDKEEMRVKIKKKLKEDAVYRYIYGLK